MKPAAACRTPAIGAAGATAGPDTGAVLPPGSGRGGILLLGAALVTLVFLALGTWQVERLHWKRDLIQRVDQRVHADPVAPPGRDRWPAVSAAEDEYRHVRVQGRYLPGRTVRVQAVTVLGSGFWLLTPLQQADGAVVMVNRGFVPARPGAGQTQPDGVPPDDASPVTVSGLLRVSEPGGAFLRHNDPSAGRWYSRDVAAIATAVGLADVAPYFIDADAAPQRPGAPERSVFAVQPVMPERPVGGLTVIAFPNSHLAYALTWYALALMTAGACLWNTPWGRRMIGRITPAALASHDGGDDAQQ